MLLARTSERAVVDGILDAARSGRSGSLLLAGDPGIGKSTLLEYAREHAGGMTVLYARGYESESEIPFAGLADLLRPVLPLLPRLPAQQAAALQSALSIGPPVPGDRFSVCAATIGILAAAAEAAPTLVVVDDVHWLDGSSREAVLFAARRLQVEGIALMMGGRITEDDDRTYAGVRTLVLEALDPAEADPLFDRLAPSAPADVRRQIYAAAAGNPLGVMELCDQWNQEPERFTTPKMPSDSRLTRALGGRMDALPENTRTALMLVAASAGADTDVVLAAARTSGLGLADFAPAEDARLLSIQDRQIRFRHPLLRSVLYGAATAHARATAHAALAGVLSEVPGDAASDARAWHLAVARLPPDEETALLLMAAADRARHRGGHEEAARAYEEAARFGDPQARPVLLLRAARAWQVAGRPGMVLSMLETALPLATDARVRALILHMDAYVRMWRREPADGLERLIAAAGEIEEVDPERAALMYADTTIPCFMLGRIEVALGLVERARELSRRAGGKGVLGSAVALAAARATQGRRGEARALLQEHADELDAGDPLARAQELAHSAFVSMWLEDYPAAERWLTRLMEHARSLGALGVLPQALAMYAELCFRVGRWTESRAAAEESIALAVESRQPDVYSRYFLARIDGLQGREQEWEAGLAGITAAVRRISGVSFAPWTNHTLGLVALADGDADEAIRRLEEVSRTPMVAQVREQSVIPWGYDLVEAYARAGRTEDGEALLARIAPAPGDPDHRLQHALAARCRGLLDPGSGVADLEAALLLHQGAGQPFERARTLLCLGERLRRGRRRAASRSHLRQALETFEQLGAETWADRARHELAATGETLSRGTGLAGLLTPQELQVATVVARGASNAEAAAALFLSPKTIEYHLSNVYRKTRLRSRGELTVLTTAAG